jgi:hypothetical protein
MVKGGINMGRGFFGCGCGGGSGIVVVIIIIILLLLFVGEEDSCSIG